MSHFFAISASGDPEVNPTFMAIEGMPCRMKSVLVTADENVAQRFGIGLHFDSIGLRHLLHRITKVRFR